MGGVLAATRPRQWTKNLVVFAPLIFAGLADAPAPWVAAIGAFVAFTLASAAVYLGNDVRDRVADALHPHKRTRPVASGTLAPQAALAWAVALAVVAALGALWLEPHLTPWIVAYLALQATYVLALKRVAFLDVTAIAIGFVLRVAGGAAAIDVPLSGSMAVTAAFLALTLGFGKRRHDLLLGEDHPGGQGAPGVARGYTRRSLDLALAVAAAATLLAYAVWAVRSGAGIAMVAGVPFVAAGLARYLWLAHRRGEGGAPEEILLRDVPLILVIVMWLASVGWTLYGARWAS